MDNVFSNNRRDFVKKMLGGTAAIGLASLANISSSVASVMPPPPAKGKSVMGLKCAPLKTVRVGLIGLGNRGEEAVRRLLTLDGVEIKALCDVVDTKCKNANQQILSAGRPIAEEYSGEEDWRKVCEREDIDLVYNCTHWELHTPIAVYAMRCGKHTTVEVPAALTLEECWLLVDTAEETQRHCMMMENCCYDFFELATLNMARNGVLGDIMHAEGAYIHDLRGLKFSKEYYWNWWRLNYSKIHTGNPYPTHGLGPVAQLMGINRGDRFDYLTSMSTNQVGMSAFAKEKFGADSPEGKQTYKLGDMNTTLLHTMNGKTIMIQHDTTSPRPYSRIHLVSGTKGVAMKWPSERIALEPNAHSWLSKKEHKRFMKKWEHPLAVSIGEKARKVGGHGGMDFIMDYRLIYCLQNGLPLDQDVYDAAAWSCVVELSELSVTQRSTSVEVPDFTRGAWKDAKPWNVI